MEKIDLLEKRLENLEKEQNKSWRFILQYLLSPAIVVVIGVYFNGEIEKDRKELQQIQIAQSIMTQIFADDEYKTLAMQRLLKEVLQDQNLKDEIESIMNNFLYTKAKNSAENGSFQKTYQIYSALEIFGDDSSKKIIEKFRENKDIKNAIEKFNTAKVNTQKALIALKKKNFIDAKKYFSNSYEAYPKYQSSEKIYKLFDKNKYNLAQANTQREIVSDIVKEYSINIPKQTLDVLKNNIDK